MKEANGEKYALLVQGYRVGEVQIRGVFDTDEEAKEFADEELAQGVPYEIDQAPYY